MSPSGSERRRFPRYDIQEDGILEVIIYYENLRAQLVDISVGGCRLSTFNEKLILKSGQELRTKFQGRDLEGDFFELPEIGARIAHVTPGSVGEKKVVYFGLEFHENQRSLMEPVIDIVKHRVEHRT